MATHSSIRAWRIPRIEEPGGLQSVGLLDTTERAEGRISCKSDADISMSAQACSAGGGRARPFP